MTSRTNDYLIESIESHAEFMWQKKHLPAVPGVQYDESGLEVLEVGAHRRGILEELEKAHVYIEQHNKTIVGHSKTINVLKSIVCNDHLEESICN